MTIGRKHKHKTPEKAEPIGDPARPNETKAIPIPPAPVEKEDPDFNKPDSDGKYSKLPRQKSNIGIYRCCMEQGHTVNPTHTKDELKGITRFWCIECGWELTLKQSDSYMNLQREPNAY